MTLEEFSLVLSELRRKFIYIAAVFGAGAIISFSWMGSLIRKIESDMFWQLNIPANSGSAGRLVEISQNLSFLSQELEAKNPLIAHNLIAISQELFNLSQNVNLYKPTIIYLTPMEVLLLKFKMSIVLGILFASPLIIYYVIKGARTRFGNAVSINKSLFVSTVVASIILFILGVAYSYRYMLPFFLKFLYQDALNLGISATFSVYSFIYFVVSTTVIMGLAFELPIVLTLLVHLGITNRKTLASYRRHAYIILLIVAAVITPDPTMFSQIMVTVPFIVLYEISLVIMRLTGK